MRCLFKLAVAVGLAVVAQVLVQPGGVGDEYAFGARVYIGSHFFGIRPDSPEMIDAAARLIERQGHMPASLVKLRACPVAQTDATEIADADVLPERSPCAFDTGDQELACSR
jgi:hypothetical protein